MQKGDLTGKPLRHGVEGLLNWAFEEVRGIGNAFRMGGHSPFEDENLPPRRIFPQMVIGAPVS